MSETDIEVGKAYVVSCPDRDGLRIGLVVEAGAKVLVRLRQGAMGKGQGWGWAKGKPRAVAPADVRRPATAREVAVAMVIH
jgi:hypothetical protein